VFPVGYQFFVEQYEDHRRRAVRTASARYLSFTSAHAGLAFGVTLELPGVTFFLARLGHGSPIGTLITYGSLRRGW
jgi:Sec-independent protein secretion pathway component TatC